MSRLVRNGKEIFGGVYDASQLTYDNSSSGLTATDAQDAIDEINTKVPFSLSVNSEGVYGYKKIVEGEEVFCPFKSGEDIEYIAPLFDSSVTYNKDDVVINGELAYKCKEDNVSGTFDSSKWEVIYLYESGEVNSRGGENIKFIAPEFSSEVTYVKGDLVIYENTLYELTEDTFQGNFDSTKWEETKLTDIEEKEENYIAPEYDTNKTYNTDDVIYYKGVVYKCLEDNITGEFNIFKWQDITLSDLVTKIPTHIGLDLVNYTSAKFKSQLLGTSDSITGSTNTLTVTQYKSIYQRCISGSTVSYYPFLTFLEPIDVTEFNKVILSGSAYNGSSGSNGNLIQIFVSDTIPTNRNNFNCIYKSSAKTVSRGTTNINECGDLINLDTISGLKYVSIEMPGCYSTEDFYMTLTKVMFIKEE